jgi:hypothetical protein
MWVPLFQTSWRAASLPMNLPEPPWLRGEKAIADVAIGESVRGFDFESGEWRCCEVQRVETSLYRGALYSIETDETSIDVNGYHPFWVVRGVKLESRSKPFHLSASEDQGASLSGRWVDSNELQVGDVLIGADGSEHAIKRIQQRWVTDYPVYNLSLAGDHNFAVGAVGLLVHNRSWCQLYADSFGLTAEQLAQKRAEVALAWGTAGGRTHGHHIVHKVGASGLSDEAVAANEESRQILLEALGPNADLADEAAADAVMASGERLHNLAIAPYDYVHSNEYVFAVHQRWLDAKNTAIVNGLELGTEVKKTLASIRKSLEEGDRL